ncbi:MAG: aldehyde dehydrogenase family protein [Candidatus Woesearchaeota archaeon]
MALISYNPYTGKIIGEVPETELSSLEEIFALGKRSQSLWSKLPLEQRSSRLEQLPNLIIERINQIVDVLIEEAGMPISEARSSTTKLIDRIKFLTVKCPEFLRNEEVNLKDGRLNNTTYQPVGTVAAVMPWNHPFMIPFWTFIPALIAGNNVIYKPSELTPFIGKEIEEIFSKLGLPEGLFSTVYGGGKMGRYLSSAAQVNMVSFAGSVRVGMNIYQEAAGNMKRLILENGGKDALVVGHCKDSEKVTEQILLGFLRHAGQLCSSVRRVYVVEDQYEKYIELLKERIITYKVGNPKDEETIVGPLKSERQVNTLDSQIEDALSLGGSIAYQGKERSGQLYPPTIITNASPEMKVVDQETFGPLLPVVRVKNLQEAAIYVNHSSFGLNASIWEDNLDEAIKLAANIDVGTVCINMLPGTHNYCTWHGVKMSGVGNILSPEGVRQFTNRKNIRYFGEKQ